MATSDDQKECQSGTSNPTAGGEDLITFSSSSSSSSLSTPSSSLPSSLSSSPAGYDAGVCCDYFTLCRSNGPTPTNFTSSHARLASPRGGVDCASRVGAVTLTSTPRMPAVLPPQAQHTALVTPCSRVDGLVRTDGGTRGGCGAAVKEEGKPVIGVSTANTHPNTPAPSPASKSLSASSRGSSPSLTMSSQTSSPSSHSHAPLPSDAVEGSGPGPCSFTCARNFARLTKELSEAKDQLFALSVQVSWSSRDVLVDDGAGSLFRPWHV